MICSNCGMILIKGTKVCGNCGQPVAVPEQKANDAGDVSGDINKTDKSDVKVDINDGEQADASGDISGKNQSDVTVDIDGSEKSDATIDNNRKSNATLDVDDEKADVTIDIDSTSKNVSYEDTFEGRKNRKQEKRSEFKKWFFGSVSDESENIQENKSDNKAENENAAGKNSDNISGVKTDKHINDIKDKQKDDIKDDVNKNSESDSSFPDYSEFINIDEKKKEKDVSVNDSESGFENESEKGSENGLSDDKKGKSVKKDRKEVAYYDADEYLSMTEKNDGLIDAEFEEIDASDSRLPSTEISNGKGFSKKGIIAVIAGSVIFAVALILLLVFVAKGKDKKDNDKSYGETAINTFFEGISERDSAKCFDIVRGNNSNQIYDEIDMRLKAFAAIDDFKVQNMEIISNKSLAGDYLRSMEIDSALDLDKAYLCEVSFRYIADGTVMPGKATIRTARTSKDKKWWIIYINIEDVVTSTVDFFNAYNDNSIEDIINGYASGVKSEADITEIKEFFGRVSIKNRGLKLRKLNAYNVSDNRMKEIAEGFYNKELKFSSTIGFIIDVKYKNGNDYQYESYDIVMALDGKSWKVIYFAAEE
ncbi:hypothetical protein SAMN04487934_10137 [Eubacterium ruminantium]|nr:hypothetical protein SAMN04487934_10137 [Eubacterium ruminantium]